MSDILVRPPDACALLVLAHGAGAGMRHPFMEGVAQALARHGVATWRFDFPYMEAGRKIPDRPPVLIAAIRDAVHRARRAAPDLPLFAGGKSMGGRMTSMAAAQGPILPSDRRGDEVRGIVFLGFPLHPARKPGASRAEHLLSVRLPMLFLQGSRDALAGMDLLEPVVHGLGRRAALHVVEGADHAFHVPVRSGRTDGDVVEELAASVTEWIRPRMGAG